MHRSRYEPGRGSGRIAGACIALLAAGLLASAQAAAGQPPKAWPRAGGEGSLFVHFGEEHVNDLDGMTILPRIVRASARYRPDLVAMSGDKVDNGTRDELKLWRDVMETYDRRGVPWLAAVGNHDGVAPGALPGGTSTILDYTDYRAMFAKRPYPMGDRRGYAKIRPRQRPAGDPAGASSHYYADVRRTRWVFLDNSCWSLTGCDAYQNPSGQNQGGETQLDFLRRVGSRASEQGKLVFVVMHIPTRDPGDQLYRTELRQLHVMGSSACESSTTACSRMLPATRESTASSWHTSRASSATPARATFRTSSTAAVAVSSPRPARLERITATGTASA